MKKRIPFTALLILVSSIAFSQTAPSLKLKWDIDPKLTPAQKTVMIKLLALFEDRCVGIKKDPRDVVSAQVKLVPAMQYRKEVYGWKREVWIELRIRGNATYQTVSGHTLDYFIGGNGKPGVVAQKIQAHWFMGMEAKRDGDSFLAYYPFDLVDEL